MTTVRLVCGNCGKVESLEAETALAAFNEFEQRGWDTIATFGYNACEECPGVSVYLPMYYAQEARGLTDPEDRRAAWEKVATETTAHEGVKFPAWKPE